MNQNLKTPTEFKSRQLWFERANQTYGASMDHLLEVLTAFTLRPVPALDASMAGLIVLRGQVIPVFDPALLAGQRAQSPGKSPAVILLGAQGRASLGLLADKVGKVIQSPMPSPLTAPIRLQAAFAGEVVGPKMARMFILNFPELAAAFGLFVDTSIIARV